MVGTFYRCGIIYGNVKSTGITAPCQLTQSLKAKLFQNSIRQG